jgi:hypothetical protein
MKTHHPNIILDFVPGGTTGVWQACDVGVQRIFKHSLKRSYHEDVVAAVLKQLDDEVDIKIDKKLGVLRDQSVLWLWKAYQTLNDPVIIKKVKVIVHQMPTETSHPFARLLKCAAPAISTYPTTA